MIAVMKRTAFARLFSAVFILLLVLTAACSRAAAPTTAATPTGPATLTILHTNDVHGHLENMPRLATAIKQARQEAGEGNSLLLDAGDAFAGSVYFKTYQGQAGLWFFNYLDYDAMCLGNHDFDGGLETLTSFVQGAGFKIISANVAFPPGNALNKMMVPWIIVERNSERYGIFGLLTEETRDILTPGVDITITDPTAAARDAVAALEKAGINKIIALTHLGWNTDLKLAAAVSDIDVIVGGHSHTLPEVYPTEIDNHGAPVLVVQAGEYARNLGRLNVSFDSAGVITGWDGSKLVPIDDKVPEDAAAAAKLAEYQAPIEKMMNTVVGKTMVNLDGARADVRTRETNLGDLQADSMLAKAVRESAVIAITTGGGIRDSIPAGEVTLGQIRTVLPFDNYLVVFNLTGKQIIAALENGVSQVEDVQGRFPQVTGLRFTWDPQAKPGSRIVSAEVKKPAGYEPLDPSAVYRVVTTNYLYRGGDGYTMFAQGTDYINLGYIDYETLAEYITVHSPVNPGTEGRISRK
jgi:2',3'-cyclic-nucleotide 2'-phosphodiesterase (5'-nucleotidase family)